MRKLRSLCATLLTLVAAGKAHAQVNVEPFRARIQEGQVSGKLGGNLSAYTGNVEGLVIGTAGLIGTDQGRHFAFLAATGDYTRLGGATSVANTFLHARYNYTLAHDWLFGELFAQSETDRFRRIKLRQLFGTGPRFEWKPYPGWSLFFGAGYMLELTREGNQANTDDDGLFHRNNNYGGLTWQVEPGIDLSHVFYFQPRFDALDDHRLMSVSSVAFGVKERLESRLDVTYRYESRVPADVKRTDVIAVNSLAYRF